MKRQSVLLVLLTLVIGCSTLSRKRDANQVSSTSSTGIQQPKLVVGIVVDQMRYDYLTKFYDYYGDDGFKRLMNNGFNAVNHHFNYVPTYTAPGHASIYTGTTPANHGIIGNNWYDKVAKQSIYNVYDNNRVSIGTNGEDGKMSPERLLTSTVTDELKLHTQDRAKVIGISIKDRGAILPAGHLADAAFWFKGKDEARFITSDFYKEELPQWVADYNDSGKAKSYLTEWNTLYPIETYKASGTDLNNYEKPPRGKEKAVFPYDLKELAAENGNYDLLKATPFGNTVVADLAIAALEGEQLGKDDVTDFLAVSFSSTDYIGHQYGVNSVEVMDTYLRLDLEIARFLKELDDKVGVGNYTLFLTADHGAVHVPAYLHDEGLQAGYFDSRTLREKLKDHVKKEFGNDAIIENVSNEQVFLNYKVLNDINIDHKYIQRYIADYLLGLDNVQKVFTRYEMTQGSFTEGTAALIQKGFHQKRSGDVMYVLDNAVISYSKTGSTHGSAHAYDTHVPCIFYGAGINAGRTARPIFITDIAPTVSTLLGIAFPNGCTGTPINEALFEK
ncbi:alkaline phosphatase [Nonlabens sp. MIC269]|uniref:alkaline phosphatase PafA n=1 Tax=Nonlabens TaxID=363408 RepID=UPI00072158B0|nr:alkaline phosphatase PafA [Nonlabens sp. MIC269]ALM21703.1 alkaline phosphatase [Nonlabens sp. MIC269]